MFEPQRLARVLQVSSVVMMNVPFGSPPHRLSAKKTRISMPRLTILRLRAKTPSGATPYLHDSGSLLALSSEITSLIGRVSQEAGWGEMMAMCIVCPFLVDG